MEVCGPQDAPLELTDEAIETSTVLEIAFKLTAECDVDVSRPCFRTSISVVLFLEEYEFVQGLEFLRYLLYRQLFYMLYRQLSNGGGPIMLKVFFVAIWLEDCVLCGQIMLRVGSRRWASLQTEEKMQEIYRWAQLDGQYIGFVMWHYVLLHALPTDTMWARLRASRKVDQAPPTAGRSEAMGKKFVRLMRLKR